MVIIIHISYRIRDSFALSLLLSQSIADFQLSHFVIQYFANLTEVFL